jgi:hypothetical protein
VRCGAIYGATKGNITDPSLTPLDVSSSQYTGTGDFPILNQLKNELNEIHLFKKVEPK